MSDLTASYAPPAPIRTQLVEYRTLKDEIVPAMVLAVNADGSVRLRTFALHPAESDLWIDNVRHGQAMGEWTEPFPLEEFRSMGFSDEQCEQLRRGEHLQLRQVPAEPAEPSDSALIPRREPTADDLDAHVEQMRQPITELPAAANAEELDAKGKPSIFRK